jgi:probable F420-dependent oxidoreductase
VEIWLNAGFVELTELTSLAPAVESAGFTGIDLPDHLFFPPEISSPYPYSDDGTILWPASAPWADPWVAIAAMATSTMTLKFGTGIEIAALRDPFTLAKAVATARAIAGPRVFLGVGAGWLREEFDTMGIDFASRGRRLDELLEILPLLWSGEAASFSGDFFTFDRITMKPEAPDVPILVGGNSRAAIRRAAGRDGWIGTHRSIRATAALIEELGDALRLRGRSLDGFRISLTGPDLLGEDLDELAALGVEAVSFPLVALGRARSLDDRLALIDRKAAELGL